MPKNPKPRNNPTALDGYLCERLCEALAQLLDDENAIAPSEMIELVDAVIQYGEAVDDILGLMTPGLNELSDARADYNGPGIHQMK